MLLSRSLTAALPLIAAMALIVGGCDRQSDAPAQPPKPSAAAAGASGSAKKELNGTLDISKRGNQMPDFAISLPDGTTKRLADFKGKPLLVNLWATWCAPCVIEMPMLDRLAVEQDGKLTVLTVSQDSEGAAKVQPFFDKGGYAKLEPWLDPELNLGFHYATGLMPTTILYDSNGREVWRMTGGHDWESGRTAALLADTLDGE